MNLIPSHRLRFTPNDARRTRNPSAAATVPGLQLPFVTTRSFPPGLRDFRVTLRGFFMSRLIRSMSNDVSSAGVFFPTTTARCVL